MPCSTIVNTTENNCENIKKLVVAYDYLLSSSDSSFEEFQYTYLIKQKKRVSRIKHYIRNVVDQYSEEEVNIYNKK